MKYGVKLKKVMKRKKIDSDPVFDEKCLRTNIKSGNKKITRNFKNGKNKPPKEGSMCICLQ